MPRWRRCRDGAGRVKLEHIAFDVAEPEAAIAWWCEHLGMRRSAPGGAFLMDSSGVAGLEIYRSAATDAPPPWGEMHPTAAHVAFASADVKADAQRLVAAGATLVSLDVDAAGRGLAMLRDPWGLPVQLAKREKTIFMEPAGDADS